MGDAHFWSLLPLYIFLFLLKFIFQIEIKINIFNISVDNQLVRY
jgi:hypothetical protein